MKLTPRKRMRAMNRDPEFAAKRDAAARETMARLGSEMRRKALASRRGVDVPPELEAEWKRLTRRRKGGLSNAEAARALGLEFKGKDQNG